MGAVALVVLLSTNTTNYTPPRATPVSNLEVKRTESTAEPLELKFEDSMAPSTKLGLKKFVKKTVKAVTSAVSKTTSAAGGLIEDTVEVVAKSVSSVATEVCDVADTLNDLPGLISEAGDSLADQTLKGLDKLKDLAEDGWDHMLDLFKDIPIDVSCGYDTDYSTGAAAELKCTVKGIPEIGEVAMTADISTSDFNIDLTIEAGGEKVGPFALIGVACLKQPNIANIATPQIALCFTLDEAVWKNSDGSVANPLSGNIGMYIKALSGTGINAELYRDDKIARYNIATAPGASSNPLPTGTDCYGGLLTCTSGSSCVDTPRRRRQPWVCTSNSIAEGQDCSRVLEGTATCASGTSCQDRRRRRRQPFSCTSTAIPEGQACSTTDTSAGTCVAGTSCQDRRRRRRQPFVCTSRI